MTNEELVYLYQQGDKQALERLLDWNKRIVYTMANRFFINRTNSIDREDLEQEGFIGLIVAANKYKIDKDNPCKFITYSVFWIRQKMQRFLEQKNTNNETSLNTPLNEDGDITLLDSITDSSRPYENIEDKIYKQQLRKKLEEAMIKYNTLKEREILKLRYGWDGSSCMSHEELGDIFNISRQVAGNSEKRALKRLRISAWGVRKAKEIGYSKRVNSYKSINRRMEYLDFESKYLNDDEFNRWCNEVLKVYKERRTI
jgi:RNA polymerase primary sigma factor/RNA polymerase sporulation-specific sigma factor